MSRLMITEQLEELLNQNFREKMAAHPLGTATSSWIYRIRQKNVYTL